MSSEKKPGFWQRLFGLGPEEPPKKEPPAPKPTKKEPELEAGSERTAGAQEASQEG